MNQAIESHTTRTSSTLAQRATQWLGSPWFLLLPAVLLFVPVFISPLGRLLGLSFGEETFTLDYYRQALGDEAGMLILWRTLVISAQVTVLTALIGYPLAYMIARAPDHRQNLLLLLVAIPLWTSTLVRSFSWIVLLGREGVVNQMAGALGLLDAPVQMLYSRPAVLLGFVHIMIPYLVFPLVSVMKRIPRGLTSVGMSLGASRVSAFWLIFLPLSLPGVTSGAILVFVLCTGYFVTPALLGGLGDMVYVMLIQQQVEVAVNWQLGAAMSVVLLIVTLVLVVLLGRFMSVTGEGGSRAVAEARKPGRLIPLACAWFGRVAVWVGRIPGRARATQALRRPRVGQAQNISTGVSATAWLIIVFLLVPILILFPLSLSGAPYLQFPPETYSLRWYRNFFARADWTSAAVLSFQVGIATMVLATAIGTSAAVALSRTTGKLSKLSYAFLIAPIFIPNLVIAVALYFDFAAYRLIGSKIGLILGHAVIATPLVVIIVLGSLKRVNPGPERAAMSLGAGRVRAFMSTTFVAIRPSIATAALFAFLASFDDVVIALFLSGVNSTLPKRMWDGVQHEIDPTIAATCVLLIVMSSLLVVALEMLRRRRERFELQPAT